MDKVDASYEFEADGVAYRTEVFLVSDSPLVYRHEFSKKDPGGEWAHVAFDDREYDDPAGKGGKNPEMIQLLQREAPLMAQEFVEYLQKKSKKKKRSRKK